MAKKSKKKRPKSSAMRSLKLEKPLTKIYVGDCREIMPKLKPGSVDLIFGDPPYNIGVDYDGWNDAMEDDVYRKFTEQWLRQAHELLGESGSLFTYVPPQLANRIAVFLEDELGMHFVNDICVVQRFGQNQLTKFVSGHRRLTYHCKCLDTRTWNIQEILVQSMRRTHYKDARTENKEMRNAGKAADIDLKGKRVPLDVWGEDEQHFGRVQGNNKERRAMHPNQVPEKVMERIILAASAKGDTVFDPFSGSGTTVTVARALGRVGLGCEISEKFARSGIKRAKQGAVRVNRKTK